MNSGLAQTLDLGAVSQDRYRQFRRHVRRLPKDPGRCHSTPAHIALVGLAASGSRPQQVDVQDSAHRAA